MFAFYFYHSRHKLVKKAWLLCKKLFFYSIEDWMGGRESRLSQVQQYDNTSTQHKKIPRFRTLRIQKCNSNSYFRPKNIWFLRKKTQHTFQITSRSTARKFKLNQSTMVFYSVHLIVEDMEPLKDHVYILYLFVLHS